MNKLQWTKEFPTEPGYYVVAIEESKSRFPELLPVMEIQRIALSCEGLILTGKNRKVYLCELKPDCYLWIGPIPLPMEYNPDAD